MTISSYAVMAAAARGDPRPDDISSCIYTDAATHLIVDVNGDFPRSADFGSLVPARLLDTRLSAPAAAAEGAALSLITR